MATPATPLDGTMRGSIARGTPNNESIAGSQSPVARFMSIVLDAFEGSVACTAPLVSRQMSQVSTLPNSRSPPSASARAPGTSSRIQRILLAEKYASTTRPVVEAISLAAGDAASCWQKGAVRRHCQTIAGATGSPVRRSHTIVVSRWLVMPIAATSAAWTREEASTARAASIWAVQIRRASCSTHPACGYPQSMGRDSIAMRRPSASYTAARADVVPSSSERMYTEAL